jgi:heptaprenyl diphosphate synthase
MRIGLANLPLLAALDLLSPGDFGVLVLVKVLGQGLITGTLVSPVFLFSLGGTLASALVMYPGRRLLSPRLAGFTGLSVLGSLCSNLVQIGLARFVVFGGGIRFLIPPFLGMGILAGAALGVFCETFTRRSRWYRRALRARRDGGGAAPAAGEPSPPPGDAASPPLPRRGPQDLFRGGELFAAGLLMTLIFLLTPSLSGRGFEFLFFLLLAALMGKKTRPFFMLAVILGTALCNLAVPYGRVLGRLGPFTLTGGSLVTGLRKGITLEGLVVLSGASVRRDPRLPGRLGRLLGESFRLLGRIGEGKTGVSRKRFIEGIDELLLRVEREGPGETGEQGAGGKTGERAAPEGRGGLKGRLILAAAILLTAALGAAGGLVPPLFGLKPGGF